MRITLIFVVWFGSFVCKCIFIWLSDFTMGRKKKIGIGHITLQLEHYLSDANLEKDKFLMDHIIYTPLPSWRLNLFSTFPKIKKYLKQGNFLKLKRKKGSVSQVQSVKQLTNVLKRAVNHSPKLTVWKSTHHWFISRIPIPIKPVEKVLPVVEEFAYLKVEVKIDKLLNADIESCSTPIDIDGIVSVKWIEM